MRSASGRVVSNVSIHFAFLEYLPQVGFFELFPCVFIYIKNAV